MDEPVNIWFILAVNPTTKEGLELLAVMPSPSKPSWEDVCGFCNNEPWIHIYKNWNIGLINVQPADGNRGNILRDLVEFFTSAGFNEEDHKGLIKAFLNLCEDMQYIKKGSPKGIVLN